jgi:exopolysaccharide biosynthesis polyprenyl glycosylphosphotransferase
MRGRIASRLRTSLDHEGHRQELRLAAAGMQHSAVDSGHDNAAAVLKPLISGHEMPALAPVPEPPGPILSAVAEPALAADPALTERVLVSEPALTAVPEIAAPALEPVRTLPDRREARLFDVRTWARIRVAADAAVLCATSSVAVASSGARTEWWVALVFPIVTLACLCAGRTPDERLRASAIDAVARVLGAVSLATLFTVGVTSLVTGDRSETLPLRLFVLAAVSVGAVRLVMLWYRQYVLATRAAGSPTLIVGAGMVGERLAARLVADPGYGLRPVGFLDTAPLSGHNPGSPLVPVVGGQHDLTQAVARTRARHVILAFTTEPDHLLVEKVKECQALGVEVSLVPRLYEAINDRVAVDHVGGLPLLSLRCTDPRDWRFAIKHGIDRLVAAIAICALAPLLAAIAVAVRVTSPGPVLFRQRRVGRDGQEFDVLKFRTMFEDSHADEFLPPEGCAPGGVEGQDRRTPIGRWLRGTSLDELPQLVNVLRGEMSIVGPRPERPEFVSLFDEEIDHYEDRHRVKSGITGWAQVNGLRGQTSIADRVEWDNYYIENWSLRFDLRIVVLTIAEVLRLRDTALCDPKDESARA